MWMRWSWAPTATATAKATAVLRKDRRRGTDVLVQGSFQGEGRFRHFHGCIWIYGGGTRCNVAGDNGGTINGWLDGLVMVIRQEIRTRTLKIGTVRMQHSRKTLWSHCQLLSLLYRTWWDSGLGSF